MSPTSEPSRSELLAEIDELRAEVARLRDVLGLAGRLGDGHRQAWAPSLFSTAAPAPDVTRTSRPEAKLELVR